MKADAIKALSTSLFGDADVLCKVYITNYKVLIYKETKSKIMREKTILYQCPVDKCFFIFYLKGICYRIEIVST